MATKTGGLYVLCLDWDKPDTEHLVLLTPFAFVNLLLCMWVKRKSRCLGCCEGRPGLLSPVNLIDENERRWGFAAVFCSMAYFVLELFNKQFFFDPMADLDPGTFQTLKFLKVFVAILNVLWVGGVFYPLLVCISLRTHLVANILGFIYLSVFLLLRLSTTMFCHEWVTAEMSELREILYFVPLLLAIVAIYACFILDFVINMICIYKRKKRVDHIDIMTDQRADKYVRGIFAATPKKENLVLKERMKKRVKYKKISGIKYSPRIICTMAIATFVLYKMAVILGTEVEEGLDVVVTFAKLASIKFLQRPMGNNMTLQHRGLELLHVGRHCFRTANCVAVLTQLVAMVLITINYRKNLRRLYKGENPYGFKYTAKPPSIVLSCMKYSGYQIAYIVWGYLIMLFILMLTCMFLAYFIFLPLLQNWAFRPVITQLLNMWPAIIMSYSVYLAQYFMCKYIFSWDKGKHLALNNRRLYNLTTYFMLMLNVMVGLFSCLKRIMMGMIFGILLISRLDRVLFMEGFEKFDSAYKAYIGMLYMDLYHTHPCLKVFARILLEIRDKKQEQRKQREMSLDDAEKGLLVEEDEKTLRYHRVRNKWLKAITLIHNPLLVVERIEKRVKDAHRKKLKEKAEAKQSLLDDVTGYAVEGAATVTAGVGLLAASSAVSDGDTSFFD